MPKESVLIAVLTTTTQWVFPSIAQMIHMAARDPERNTGVLNLHNVVPTSAARNRAAQVLLSVNSEGRPFEWLFQIDNDMDPPLDLFDLLDRPEVADKDIIAARCQNVGWTGDTIEACWQPLTGLHEPRPWLELGRAGTGALFVRRRVFERLRSPWFQFVLNDAGDLAKGEDFYFCDKARSAGYRIWGFDSDQYEVGHVKPINLSNIAPALRRLGNTPAPPANQYKGFTGAGIRARREMRWRDMKPENAPKMDAERNDPCPCGSGRKFKKCCGQ